MKRLLLLVLMLLPASMLQAQGLDIGLVSGNEASLPIAVVPMPYQGSNAPPGTDVAEGIRNDLTEPLIRQIFTRWHIVSLQQAPIPSDTRQMIALVTRLEHPKT